MPQMKPSHLILSLLVTAALTGCGDKNDKAIFSTDDGHPSGWVKTHKTTAKTDIKSCKTCHGDNYDGGISSVSCMSATSGSGFTCHVTSPAVNTNNCVSCHGGLSSGPFGTTAPNRKSAHTKHTALTGCASCHLNAGYGTDGHSKAAAGGGYSKASVDLTSTFNINSAPGPYGYNSDGTCSNVSCHGGKITPVWASGTIVFDSDDNNLCFTCHSNKDDPATGVPQYNSFYSSANFKDNKSSHTFHLEQIVNGASVKCTNCHNIGTLTVYQKHFAGIADKTFTAPKMTIGGDPTKIGSYTASTKECSNVVCHQPFGGFGGQWVTAP